VAAPFIGGFVLRVGRKSQLCGLSTG